MAKKQTNKPMAKAPGKANLPEPMLAAQSKGVPQMPREDTARRFSVHLKLAFFLGIISFMVYANTLRNGYVYDDPSVISENTIVQKGISAIPEILATPYRRGIFITSNDLYRPLSLVTFAVEYQFFGLNPLPNHLVNILLFAGCVILLFLFLDLLLERKKTAVAFIASLLFALHPIHTEVVANIKSRDELLCFFFAFLSLNVFIKYMRGGKTAQLLIASLCFFLSLLSKETTITFLAIIPLIFFFYLNGNKTRSVYITLSAVAAAIIFLSVRYSVLSYYHANAIANISFIDNPLASKDISYASRMATAVLVMGYYLKLLLVPYPLVSDYSYNSIPFVNFSNLWVLLSLSVYIGIVYYGIKRLKNKDLFAFGILFFLVTISLFSNIPFLIGTIMGERLLFTPSVGFCLVAAAVAGKWVAGTELTYVSLLKNRYLLLALVPVCVVFAALTISRNSDWKDNVTLFKTDAGKSPDNTRLNCFYAVGLINASYYKETDTVKKKQIVNESIAYLRKVIAIAPDYADAHADMGQEYSLINNFDSSEVHEKRAIELAPNNYTAIFNLGAIYKNQQKYAQAIQLFKQALAINPNYTKANEQLGFIYLQEKQYDTAIYYLGKAVAPADACLQVGNAYLNDQNYGQAEIYFEKTLAIRPADVTASNNLASVYFINKKYAQAIGMYKNAIKLKPDYVDPYTNIAECYINTNQLDSCIYYLNKAKAVDPTYNRTYACLAKAYKLLNNVDSVKKYEAMAPQNTPAAPDGDLQAGIAYFGAQNYGQAEIYFKKAIALKPNDVNAINNLGVLYSKTGKLRQALELYQRTVAIDPAYANGYSNVGHCYFEMKQYKETIANINKAIALDPQKVADIPFLALSYKGLGVMDPAKKYEAMAQKYIPGFRL